MKFRPLIAFVLSLLLGACASSSNWDKLIMKGSELHSNGNDAEALKQFNLALKESETFPEGDERKAITYDWMGHASMADYSKLDSAEKYFSLALKERRSLANPKLQRLATNLYNLGRVYEITGRYPEAEPLFREACHIHEKLSGPDSAPYAATMHNLAMNLCVQRQFKEAEEKFRAALKIYEKSGSKTERKQALLDFADFWLMQNKPDEAAKAKSAADKL